MQMEHRRRLKHSLTQIPDVIPQIMPKNDFEPYSPTEEPTSLSKRMLKVLTHPHMYIKYSKSGNKTCCSVYFSETLQKLSIDKPYVNYILTTDLYSAELELSATLSKALEGVSSLYGFRIVTKKKTYEFTTENKNLRNEFVKSLNTLIRLSREYMSSMGLKKYCESLIHSKETEDTLKELYRSRLQLQVKRQNQVPSHLELEMEIIKGTLNSIISQLEIAAKQEECNNLRHLIATKTIERSKLTYSQESIKNLIMLKDKEMNDLKFSIKKAESQIEQLRKPYFVPDSNIFTLRTWSCIIEFLGPKDVVVLRSTSRTLRSITSKSLSIKPVWRKLCLSTLTPRGIMYRLYIGKFYKSAIRGKVYEVHNDISEEIHNDVWKGLTDHNKETEEILIRLCKYNQNLSYCQGMHFVAHFLFGIFGNSEEVLRMMDSLLRPPFYLAELWKNGFSRLKLGLFQLDFILKIRLPFMYKHLKDLEINLDMIVTPWFLTVFTYFHYQQELSKKIVLEIWDFFLLHGWPAIISVCLAIFHLTQELVLDKSLEQTLTILTSQIPCKQLSKTIQKFEIDPRLLDDLEGSFLCSNFKSN